MKNIHKLFVTMILTFCIAVTAIAQSNSIDKNITLTTENSDIRNVIKLLFKDTIGSYSLAQDVTGGVTVNLKDVPFIQALKIVLDQANSTFSIENNIFIIKKKDFPSNVITYASVPSSVKQENSIRRIKIIHADPQLIILLLAGLTNVNTPPEISSTPNRGG